MNSFQRTDTDPTKIRSRRPSRGTVLGALALLVATGGVAYAAIPSADGVIHSCYSTGGRSTGTLRVIDADSGATCAKNEKPLTFNQTGPQGPQGTQGPRGETGAPGAPGVDGDSAAYVDLRSGVLLISGAFTTVASLDLPAGSYALAGQASVNNGTPADARVICVLYVGEASVDGTVPGSLSFSSVGPTGGARADVSISNQGVTTLDAPNTVFMQCATPNGEIDGSSLIAIKIATVTVTDETR